MAIETKTADQILSEMPRLNPPRPGHEAEYWGLTFRHGDLKAELLLNNLGMLAAEEPEYHARECSMLLNASIYLRDRLAYELDRTAVLHEFWAQVP